jgi:hypothetical protein
MKKIVDTKAKLFENMQKLNPEFKLVEGKTNSKLITESIEEMGGMGVNYKMKVDKIKKFFDMLLADQEFDAINSLYQFLKIDKVVNKQKSNPEFSINESKSVGINEHESKVLEMKNNIKYLFENNFFNEIEKIEEIIVKAFPKK